MRPTLGGSQHSSQIHGCPSRGSGWGSSAPVPPRCSARALLSEPPPFLSAPVTMANWPAPPPGLRKVWGCCWGPGSSLRKVWGSRGGAEASPSSFCSSSSLLGCAHLPAPQPRALCTQSSPGLTGWAADRNLGLEASAGYCPWHIPGPSIPAPCHSVRTPFRTCATESPLGQQHPCHLAWAWWPCKGAQRALLCGRRRGRGEERGLTCC